MLIYVDTPFQQAQKDQLKTGAPEDEFVFKDELDSKEEQKNTLLKADIVLGNPRPAEWLTEAKNLKWMQLYSAGFEYYRGIEISAPVTNLQDFFSQPCAETMVAGIMALYRGMDFFGVLKEKKKWVGHTQRSELQLLMNRKVIILGWGTIGKRVGKILSGFSCETKIYARSAQEASIRTPGELENEIGWADIIIGCLPGTAETKGLFTSSMIRKMKKTALFCNVGRGNLVADESVLIEALNTNAIGGAVLDVTAEEPIPEDHPLWDCPNTILSQHSGGGNANEYYGIAEFFLKNLQKLKNKEPLENIVDFARGY